MRSISRATHKTFKCQLCIIMWVQNLSFEVPWGQFTSCHCHFLHQVTKAYTSPPPVSEETQGFYSLFTELQDHEQLSVKPRNVNIFVCVVMPCSAMS